MNHIARLISERDAAREHLREVQSALRELQHYLLSDKFAWPDGDYVHVRTDLLPKVNAIAFLAIEEPR